MRAVVAVAVASTVLVLAGYQGLATVALRDRASSGALVRFVPLATAARVDALGPRVAVPSALRLVLARKALAAGDVVRAERDAAALPPSTDRLALMGEIARARGDTGEAVRDELAAGDLAGVQRQIDALVAAANVDDAVALERALIARLDGDRTQTQAQAEAQFDLGLLEEREAWRYAVGSAVRESHERASYAAYARAVDLAPLSERYLLGFGNQALNIGAYAPEAYDAAGAAFARARTANPTSSDAYVGLGDLALRRGDRNTASENLARARALDPHSAAVARLAQALGF